ncbi:MAG: PQQ-dependent sugar dehydrogenase, partial [Verrucomicrobiota bacterium]|nr:PQQ-dependent sugar dehydrogenase [Verrucomicrobiota bacterium]
MCGRLFVGFLLLFAVQLIAQVPSRVENTSLKMPASPGIPQYRTADRFPGLRFNKPVALVTAPGQPNSLYIVERSGRILVIPDVGNPQPTLFLDIQSRVFSDFQFGYAEGLASVAFHPNYQQNGLFYVVYTTRLETSQGSGNHNRLSRFSRVAGQAFQADPNSESPMITQKDEGDGHNFNDLFFGNDGFLYVAAGDEGDGGTGDDYQNSQRIDKDFFSAILRIDVDELPTSLAPRPHPAIHGGYRIPSDNPFVGKTDFNGLPIDPSKLRAEF